MGWRCFLGFLLHQLVHDGLDGVHPVFRLVKDDGGGGLEHLVGDLHGLPAELLAHLLAPYQVTKALMDNAGPQCMNLHWGPALSMRALVTW